MKEFLKGLLYIIMIGVAIWMLMLCGLYSKTLAVILFIIFIICLYLYLEHSKKEEDNNGKA